MKCELKFAGIILLVIGSFGCKEAKEAKEGSSEERKQLELIYQELSAQYDTLRLQVVREPAGYLKYPYLIPADFILSCGIGMLFLWQIILSAETNRNI